MDIIIEQNDLVYRYRCNEECNKCPMRYICYTNKRVDNILRLRGHSCLDLLMIRGRLDHLIGNQELLCLWCYRIHMKDIARGLGETCPVCNHCVTCDDCDNDDCHFRGDLYNTDGACLMTK